MNKVFKDGVELHGVTVKIVDGVATITQDELRTVAGGASTDSDGGPVGNPPPPPTQK